MKHPLTYHSNGKLLLTSEYLVLKGAKALALPLNVGQKLVITPNNSNYILWETYQNKSLVFSAVFSFKNIKALHYTDKTKAIYLSELLKAMNSLNPILSNYKKGVKITTTVEFNMNWGFGSSSSLIANLSKWAQINPFNLNKLISNGSGYDIACADANNPIIFQLKNQTEIIKSTVFNPNFIKNLSLVYLNKKMPTEANILKFINNKKTLDTAIIQANNFTSNIIACTDIDSFMRLIKEHEKLIGKCINQTPVKERYFNDFNGEIKSLGAWGGDFILTASNLPLTEQKKWFNARGYSTIFSLKSVIK